MKPFFIVVFLSLTFFPTQVATQNMGNYKAVHAQLAVCIAILKEPIVESYTYEADTQLCESALNTVGELEEQKFSADDRISLSVNSHALASKVVDKMRVENEISDWVDGINRCREICNATEVLIRDYGILPKSPN
jgi:hypothetical protein